MTIKIPKFQPPKKEELQAFANSKYERIGKFNIDMWPDEVSKLSMPTKLIEIKDVSEFCSIFDADPNVLKKYSDLLEPHFEGEKWFIRTNYRSPKDYSYPEAPIATSGKEAMQMLSLSMRVMDDMFIPANTDNPLYICLRQVVEMNLQDEYRCFAKDGKLLAVSNYDIEAGTPCKDDCELVWDACERFYNNHLAKHYETVVFDLHKIHDENPLLIELNPYGLSHPCFFDNYEIIENIGGVMLKYPCNKTMEQDNDI